MRKAGGLIGIIAGAFGVLAGVFTLIVGPAIFLGWSGIIFSLLCIICGAITMFARTHTPAAYLVLFAILGILLGNLPMVICMAVAFIGGQVAIFGGEDRRST